MNGFTTRPELRGTFGMVSSTHWLATAAGMSVLERGGNAFDAAVATGFALQVVAPNQNGPGGEVPILLHTAAEPGAVSVICGQGPAPAAATIERFRDLGLALVPGIGLLAACVPGAFDAWMLLLRDHGTLRLRDVLEHAIGYAERGFAAAGGLSEAIAAADPLFRSEWPGSAELWLPGPRPGGLVRSERMAATYRRVIAEAEARASGREEQIEAARDVWYRGFVAEAIGDFTAATEALDSSGERHRGLLTADDMAAWSATVEPPVRLDYRGWTVCKTDTWGQGPVFLQQLALLDGFDVDGLPREGPDFVHTVVECAKLAFADREAWYGDPARFDVPIGALLSERYAAERRALVGDEASFELRPGRPDGREPRLPATPEPVASAPGTGEPTRVPVTGEPTRLPATGEPVRGDTCHLATADRHGNLVSAMPSGGWLYGSPAIPELGFCLTTRAQMFWLEEGLPASLAPGARPRTTLSPALALRDGEPALAFGSPGGDQQDQWALAFFLTHVHEDRGLQAAIDAPMFDTLHFPSSFWPRGSEPGRVEMEERFPGETIAELRRRGHDVAVAEPWSLGRMSAVGTEPDGVLTAAADARGGVCYAAGR
ncbi:MAG TPA: gamma-glutamyltransferase [Thermoleophilaceae bacterium]